MRASASRGATRFRARATRALELAPASPAAREMLRFASRLSEAQARTFEELEVLHAGVPLSGSLARDGERVLAHLGHVAGLLSEPAPGNLLAYWGGARRGAADAVARVQLRPYVELLRELGIPPDASRAAGCCPFCGAAPLLALRRGGAQGEGAARSLLCGLCGNEWGVARIRCPVCAEADPARLPNFHAEEYPSVRLEACEGCRRYLKSLEVAGRNPEFPEVDELLSVALDLWAEEQGFTRPEPALPGL